MPKPARRLPALTTAVLCTVSVAAALIPAASAAPSGMTGAPGQDVHAYADVARANTVTPEVRIIASTETSVTFRVTLPEGMTTTRDGVLQAYTEQGGRRISRLSALTDPAAGFGADHRGDYDTQSLELEPLRLLRQTFSVDGATPISWGGRDHLELHAGERSVDVTVHSRLTKAGLAAELGFIPVGRNPAEREQLAQQLMTSRLAVPLDATWSYGDRLPVERSPRTLAEYVNAANELTVTRTGTRLNTTVTFTHPEGEELIPDRILNLEGGDFRDLPVRELDDRTLNEVLSGSYPPPLRFGKITTRITGADHYRDGFYSPAKGVKTVTVRTTGTGPTTESEARTRFAEWAVGTCGAGMSTAIPGYPTTGGGAAMTWQRYIDTVAPRFGKPDPDAAAPLYTDVGYLEAIRNETDGTLAEFLDRLPTIDDAAVVSALGSTSVDWDLACANAVAGGSGPDPADPLGPSGGGGGGTGSAGS